MSTVEDLVNGHWEGCGEGKLILADLISSQTGGLHLSTKVTSILWDTK